LLPVVRQLCDNWIIGENRDRRNDSEIASDESLKAKKIVWLSVAALLVLVRGKLPPSRHKNPKPLWGKTNAPPSVKNNPSPTSQKHKVVLGVEKMTSRPAVIVVRHRLKFTSDTAEIGNNLW
jgi:hypothetical protein